jgi:hypothetical protein
MPRGENVGVLKITKDRKINRKREKLGGGGGLWNREVEWTLQEIFLYIESRNQEETGRKVKSEEMLSLVQYD